MSSEKLQNKKIMSIATGIKNKEKIEKYRYERKFFVQDLQKPDIETLIKVNPSAFSEVYYERKVNSIYLDTEDLASYYDNIFGSANRSKVRIRWYGDDLKNIEDPNLEIKIKTGLLGRKIIFPLDNFILKDSFKTDISNILVESKISEPYKTQISFFSPIILISYDRKYFLSADKRFRLTLDSNMAFYQMNVAGGWERPWYQEGSVVELKYDFDGDDKASTISGYFPFRLSRSSKYMMGIDCIFGNKI